MQSRRLMGGGSEMIFPSLMLLLLLLLLLWCGCVLNAVSALQGVAPFRRVLHGVGRQRTGRVDGAVLVM